ncbi:glycosyltransferase [Methylomagnum sp.]
MSNGSRKEFSYVLMTSARNEEKYIEGTLQSVVAQTLLPKKWVVISDGSTDDTDSIIKRYASRYEFIHYLRTHHTADRTFGSKVYALRLALREFEACEFDVIGNLDADVTFSSDYFSRIMTCFQADSELGIAGGLIHENHGGHVIPHRQAIDLNVAGASQNFRRECFERIGGYRPLPKGGEDPLADLMARMYGWKVKTFPKLIVMHHRHCGTASGHKYKPFFDLGRVDSYFGFHPLFELAKCFSRVDERPYLVGSLIRLLGYCYGAFSREPLAIPRAARDFLRKEQLGRLADVFRIPQEL